MWHAGADAGGADAGGADAASGGGGGGAAAGEVMAVLTSTLPVMSRDVEGVYCTQAASVWHRGCWAAGCTCCIAGIGNVCTCSCTGICVWCR